MKIRELQSIQIPARLYRRDASSLQSVQYGSDVEVTKDVLRFSVTERTTATLFLDGDGPTCNIGAVRRVLLLA